MATWEYIVLGGIVLVFAVTITAGAIVAVQWHRVLKDRERVYGLRK